MWGMPWRQEAKKGVEDCEKLGGLVKRELIPRYPQPLNLEVPQFELFSSNTSNK
jgi:hypothetical protein